MKEEEIESNKTLDTVVMLLKFEDLTDFLSEMFLITSQDPSAKLFLDVLC